MANSSNKQGSLPKTGPHNLITDYIHALLDDRAAGNWLCTYEEIIIQTIPYAGFPTAINALSLLKEILSKNT